MLGLFVNTLTADGNYSRHNRENFPQRTQMQLSQKTKFFIRLFTDFGNLHQILITLKKSMNLIAEVFPKLLTPHEVRKSPF